MNNKDWRPSTEEVKQEISRVRHRRRYRRTLNSTVYYMLLAAALAVLVSTLWLPVLRIYGSSMTPTLEKDELVIVEKHAGFQTGDVCAFYYNNRLLVKRVIANPGDWVNIDEDGNVYVNGTLLEEPYVTEKALGQCNLELPYQVPDERYFVMGDDRAVSLDSRNTAIGCISEEQVLGKIIFRIWPLSEIGAVR